MWHSFSLTCCCVDGAARVPSNAKRHVKFKDSMSSIASTPSPGSTLHHTKELMVLAQLSCIQARSLALGHQSLYDDDVFICSYHVSCPLWYFDISFLLWLTWCCT
jgi:hypothetical protein